MVSIERKRNQSTAWSRKFAWLPVWIWNNEHRIVGTAWLEWVERRWATPEQDIRFHRPIRAIDGYEPID